MEAASIAESNLAAARASDARVRARARRTHTDSGVIIGRNFDWNGTFDSTHRCEYSQVGGVGPVRLPTRARRAEREGGAGWRQNVEEAIAAAGSPPAATGGAGREASV